MWCIGSMLALGARGTGFNSLHSDQIIINTNKTINNPKKHLKTFQVRIFRPNNLENKKINKILN